MWKYGRHPVYDRWDETRKKRRYKKPLGKNIMACPIHNQKTIYCATPNNLCFCTTWQNVETWESHFFHSNAVLVHCQNSTSPSLISSVFLTHDSYSRCCMTPYILSSMHSAWGCCGYGLGERKLMPQQLDCVAFTMHVHQCAVFLKEKNCHLWCVW